MAKAKALEAITRLELEKQKRQSCGVVAGSIIGLLCASNPEATDYRRNGACRMASQNITAAVAGVMFWSLDLPVLGDDCPYSVFQRRLVWFYERTPPVGPFVLNGDRSF
jgi:hypothetical protein